MIYLWEKSVCSVECDSQINSEYLATNWFLITNKNIRLIFLGRLFWTYFSFQILNSLRSSFSGVINIRNKRFLRHYGHVNYLISVSRIVIIRKYYNVTNSSIYLDETMLMIATTICSKKKSLVFLTKPIYYFRWGI